MVWHCRLTSDLQEARETGEDFDQLKRLETSAAELERRDRKRRKKNPDMGFSGEEEGLRACVAPVASVKLLSFFLSLHLEREG